MKGILETSYLLEMHLKNNKASLKIVIIYFYCLIEPHKR